jgi:hypothetical protein
VGNNPLKYIDPTGRVKVVPFDMDLEDYEIDILSPIEGTYQNNNFFLKSGKQSLVVAFCGNSMS